MGTTYAELSELDRYWHGFIGEFYGVGTNATTSVLVDMLDAFDDINEVLRGVDSIATIPVGTQVDGKYPKSLRELQCREVIFRKAIAEKNIDLDGNIPQHIQLHFDTKEKIKEQLLNGDRLFHDQISHHSVGVQGPNIATKAGKATFYNNVGIAEMPYLGDDFPRDFRIKIDGTNGGNGIGQSTFKYSLDNGFSYPYTNLYTGTQWIHLVDGVYVRWHPGNAGNQIELNDEWYFRAIPDNVKTVYSDDAVSMRRIRRG